LFGHHYIPAVDQQSIQYCLSHMFALAVHPEKLHPGTQCHMSLQAAKEITKQGKPTLVGSMQIFMGTLEREVATCLQFIKTYLLRSR